MILQPVDLILLRLWRVIPCQIVRCFLCLRSSLLDQSLVFVILLWHVLDDVSVKNKHRIREIIVRVSSARSYVFLAVDHLFDSFPLLVLREIDDRDLPDQVFLWNDFPTECSALAVIRHVVRVEIDVIDAAAAFVDVVAPCDADQILVLIPLRIDFVAFGSCEHADLTVCLSFIVAEDAPEHSRLCL